MRHRLSEADAQHESLLQLAGDLTVDFESLEIDTSRCGCEMCYDEAVVTIEAAAKQEEIR